MYCEKCGKEMQEEWTRCPYCGQVLKGIAEPVNNALNMENGKEDKGGEEDKNGEDNKTNSTKIKYRSFLKYLLLSFLTLGIYGIYMFYGLVKDVNNICEGDGKRSPNYIVVLLLSMVTCGVYGIYWWYRQGERIKASAPKYGVQIQESGMTILVWVLLGRTIMPLVGSLVATYIMFDNVNRVALGYNKIMTMEELANMGNPHPHLIRNSLIIWIVCMVSVFALLILLASFSEPISTEDKITTKSPVKEKLIKPDKKKAKSINGINLSNYKNQSVNELKKVVTDLEDNGEVYCNSDKTLMVTINDDETINSITIKGNPKIAPYFAQVHLEDNVEEVDKKIKVEYRITNVASTVKDAQGNVLREYREKNTTNKLSIIYEGKSKKITEINWIFNGIDFIFPNSSEKLLESKEIENLTDIEKQIAINEIFARHGRRFDNVDIQKYFESKGWYNGSIAPADFDEKVFNSVEKDNILRLSGKSDTEQEKQNTVKDEEVINGYIHINASILAILKNPEQYIGKKVCFDGVLQKNFNGILELSYFEGGGEIQVSAYYDKNKLRVMPEEPVHDASTIVWGTVSGANEQTGVEIQLESIYIGANDIYFAQNATQYYQVPSFRELNYSDNFDLGEKIILEGMLEYDDNKIGYKLTMEDGRCLLSSSMEAFADMSIYEVTSLDSFLDKRVRVYGFYGSAAPLIAVEYIEPLE